MMLAAMLLAVTLSAQEPFDSDDPLDADFRTGVAVGARIPEFRVKDFSGREWDFDTIKGPRGALLHFYRSADW